MEAALAAAPLAAAAGAALFGCSAWRLSGVYLAMLTLAFAQIAWFDRLQWDSLPAVERLVGVWPASWLASRPAFYLLTLALCSGGVWLLRRSLFSPFRLCPARRARSPLRAGAVASTCSAYSGPRSPPAEPSPASPAACSRSEGQHLARLHHCGLALDRRLVMGAARGRADAHGAARRRRGVYLAAGRDRAKHRLLAGIAGAAPCNRPRLPQGIVGALRARFGAKEEAA